MGYWYVKKEAMNRLLYMYNGETRFFSTQLRINLSGFPEGMKTWLHQRNILPKVRHFKRL